jgi:hypothetical protein
VAKKKRTTITNDVDDPKTPEKTLKSLERLKKK